MTTHSVNIDDYDSADIDYQNPSLWNHQIGQQNVQGGTYTAGFTNAVAKFTFNGSEVLVFGVANPPPANHTNLLAPSISFSIDGGTPNVVSSPPVKSPQYSYQFYDSHSLPAGQHTLQILVNNGEEDWPFVLDYIQYSPLLSSTPSPASSSPGTSASASTTGISTPSEAANVSHKSHPVGAIVGGVIAGVVGLSLLAFVLWFCFFRVRMQYSYKYHAATKVDLLDQEPKPHVPSIHPSTTVFESSYAGDERPFPSQHQSYGADSIYASTEPARAFSPDFTSSRPSSPSLGPGTPPAMLARPGTPPAVFHTGPTTTVLYPPGSTAPVVPSPLGKAAAAAAGGEGDAASVRSTAPVPVTLFHADSGIRFVPVPPLGQEGDGEYGAAEVHPEVEVSEVPPEYTES
ncbi:hypothetical protein BC628DRAFT_1335812 [Trametes gibbosa]|nr:hypothetical protein BC628DRAFT_1335812 [Trametes gibbosa]